MTCIRQVTTYIRPPGKNLPIFKSAKIQFTVSPLIKMKIKSSFSIFLVRNDAQGGVYVCWKFQEILSTFLAFFGWKYVEYMDIFRRPSPLGAHLIVTYDQHAHLRDTVDLHTTWHAHVRGTVDVQTTNMPTNINKRAVNESTVNISAVRGRKKNTLEPYSNRFLMVQNA